MPIRYNKLFHVLIDQGIKKGELQEKANITASIMARLAKDETVRTDTIAKICKALRCQPGEIMEYIEIEELLDENGNVSNDTIEIMPTLEHGEFKGIGKRYYPPDYPLK